MKILYVVHRFFPEYVGGTERDALDVAHEMQRRGHRVAIFHRAPGSPELVRTEYEGIPVYRAQAGPMEPWPLFVSTFHHRALKRYFCAAFSETDPDLVHFQHLLGLPAGVVSWARRMGRPVVMSLRDFWFVCPNAQLLTNDTHELCEKPGRPIRCVRCGLARANMKTLRLLSPLFAPVMAARNRTLRRVVREANTLLVSSQFVQQWFAHHGVSSSQFRHVKRGIQMPERWPLRSRSDDRVRFTYIGGLSWQKGVHVLIEAFNALEVSAELIIAGDETKFPDYTRHLREIAQHPGIRFVGRLNREGVWQTLVDSDVVVVPSLWFETYSMILHEAFAAGVPVIAAAHGALEEAVRDGVDGLLVLPGDVIAWQVALQRVVDEPGLLTRLRANVRPPITLGEHVDRMESLYTQLVDRSSQA